MAENAKNFLVSTADFAFYVDGILACTGYTNLNASLEVSMQEQNVNAGKGNKLAYSYKYGRELSASLEAADWKLEFIACQVGSKIFEGMDEVYKMGECVNLTQGVGVVAITPIGDVAVELPNGAIIMVKPEGSSIDLSSFGLVSETVKATYQYNRMVKKLTIDAESTPYVGRLVLDADKHNNKLGKVGSVQIEIPSYQLSGNFSINFTPDGVTSTSMEGKALAVEGDSCADGNVYAYIREFDNTEKALAVNEIAATPAVITLGVDETAAISVVGLKGALYSPIELDASDCTFVCDTPAVATVAGNVVTAVGAGSAKVTVSYQGMSDECDIVVK